jgi:hypothetical protein
MGMTTSSTSRPTRVVVLVTGLAVAAIILAWGITRPPHNAYDDAYITYRYADNLRQGLGLVYNPGEWVLGTTTPLFALLLGTLGLITPDLEMIGHWMGVFCWIVAAWAAIALLWQAGWPRAGLVAGLLLAVEATFLRNLGMETSLLVALMLAVAWAWLGGRKWLTIFLAAALLLTRQDSALWLLLLGLEVWRSERTLPWREALGTVLLVSPWFLFAWWRYGSILPNTTSAKLAHGELMYAADQSTSWHILWQTGTAGLHPAAVGISVVAFLLGVWVILRFARSLFWLVAWAILYIAVYSWLDVPSFPWYYVPPLAIATLIMALGFGYPLGDRKAESREQSPERRRPIIAALLPALSGCLVIVLLLTRASQVRTISAYRGNPAAYVQVGQWLAGNTPVESSVASIEIGVIGYLSQRPVLDTMGLVSPDMTRHQLGWIETLVYALNVHQPDYAVVLPNTAWDGIVDRWWFQKQYEPVAHVDEITIYGLREPTDESIEMPFQVNYVDGLALTGASLNSRTIQPGMTLEVWLHVDVQAPPPSGYLFTLYLMDAQTYERVAIATAAPFDGRYGSRHWQAGDQLALPVRLEIPHDLQPGAYRLGVVIYDTERETGLPLRDLPDVPDPDVHVGWFRLGSPAPPLGSSEPEAQLLQVQWQDGIELTGIRLTSQPLAPGAMLPVHFAWRTAQPIIRDLTVFVHLIDSQGEIVAQQDRSPFYGRWPTPVWQPGEVLRDTFELALSDSLPPGRYGLRFGFYDQTGRLMLADGSADYWLIPDAVQVVGQP